MLGASSGSVTATASTKISTPGEIISSSFANSGALRQPDREKNTTTTNMHNKRNTNFVRELCSSSDKCSTKQKLQACQKPQFDNKVKKISGSIFTIPESNMTSADLASFCGTCNVSDIGSMLRVQEQSSSSASEVNAMVCERTIPGDVSGVQKFPSDSSGQKLLPLIAFPAWGKINPEDFKYEPSNNDWKDYTTGFVSPDQDMCFWPEVPQLVDETTSSSNKQQLLSILTRKDPIYANKLFVSGGFFDNFWHALFILNSWCIMKDD